MLIINADDFGYSDSVNDAIVACFERGYCSSTTIMANMGAFDAACQIAHQRNLLDRVGVHLVLTEGEPLTHRIRQCPRFCDDSGRFRLTRRERVWRLSASEKTAVAEELHAQIARCRSHGLPLSHADSHQHVHEEWGILPVVMRVCKKEGIAHLRIARNCGKSTGVARSLYRNLLNRRLRRRGLARTELFGSSADFRALLQSWPNVCTDHSVEVMIHPRHSADGHLIDYVLAGVWPVCLDELLSASTSEPCIS